MSPSGSTCPSDNTPPWGGAAVQGYVTNTSNVTHYVGNSSNGVASWGSGQDRQISPAGDIDCAVMECGKANGLVSQGKINNVGIRYTPAAGDLDLYVYDPSGVFLGQSIGTSGSETVNVSSLGLNSVIV